MKHNTIDQKSIQYFYRSRNLPHLYDNEKPVFITYRLKFSIPKDISDELSNRRMNWHKKFQEASEHEREVMIKDKELNKFRWFDECIANSKDIPQLLNDTKVSNIVSEAFHYFDSKYYLLQAFCIMPNHVHVLIKPLIQSDGLVISLARITYSWKKYTAYRINKLFSRKGTLWQQESYDHLIRDDRDFSSTLHYIVDNPVKAGFVDKWDDWENTWVDKEIMSLLQEVI